MIFVPIGLPGSGKSTLGRSLKNTINSVYVDCDELYYKGFKLEDLVTYIKNLRGRNIYLDGLFITENVQRKLFEELDCLFIWFNDSKAHRQQYAKNDLLRNRKLNSTNIILKAKVNKPTFGTIFTVEETNNENFGKYVR